MMGRNWHHHEFHLNRAGRARWWIDGKIRDTLNKGWKGYEIWGISHIAWIHIAGSLIGTDPTLMGRGYLTI
jgi:hypothetical protein